MSPYRKLVLVSTSQKEYGYTVQKPRLTVAINAVLLAHCFGFAVVFIILQFYLINTSQIIYLLYQVLWLHYTITIKSGDVQNERLL